MQALPEIDFNVCSSVPSDFNWFKRKRVQKISYSHHLLKCVKSVKNLVCGCRLNVFCLERTFFYLFFSATWVLLINLQKNCRRQHMILIYIKQGSEPYGKFIRSRQARDSKERPPIIWKRPIEIWLHKYP